MKTTRLLAASSLITAAATAVALFWGNKSKGKKEVADEKKNPPIKEDYIPALPKEKPVTKKKSDHQQQNPSYEIEISNENLISEERREELIRSAEWIIPLHLGLLRNPEIDKELFVDPGKIEQKNYLLHVVPSREGFNVALEVPKEVIMKRRVDNDVVSFGDFFKTVRQFLSEEGYDSAILEIEGNYVVEYYDSQKEQYYTQEARIEPEVTDLFKKDKRDGVLDYVRDFLYKLQRGDEGELLVSFTIDPVSGSPSDSLEEFTPLDINLYLNIHFPGVFDPEARVSILEALLNRLEFQASDNTEAKMLKGVLIRPGVYSQEIMHTALKGEKLTYNNIFFS